MSFPILLETVLHESALDLLATACEVIRCPSGPEGVAIARRVAAQAAIVGSTWRFSGDVLDQVPSLRVIGRPGIGVDNIDLGAAAARGISVVNTPDGPTVSTAEHTVALLLALAKRLRSASRLFGSGGSPYAEPPHVEVGGKVLGLCARGPIVDETALVAALRAGQLAGAGLDVFDPEPPSPTHPLFAMENVVATPHSAGFTEDALRKMGLGVAEGVLAVLNGVRPVNLVTVEASSSPHGPVLPRDGADG